MKIIFDVPTDKPRPGAAPFFHATDEFDGVWDSAALLSFFRTLAAEHPEVQSWPGEYWVMLRVDPQGADLHVLLQFLPGRRGSLFVSIFAYHGAVQAAERLIANSREIVLAEVAGVRACLVPAPDARSAGRMELVFMDAATGAELTHRNKPKRKPRKMHPGRSLEFSRRSICGPAKTAVQERHAA